MKKINSPSSNSFFSIHNKEDDDKTHNPLKANHSNNISNKTSISFKQNLTNKLDTTYQKDIQSMLTNLNELGEKLSSIPTLYTFEQYKDTLKKLIKKLVDKNYVPENQKIYYGYGKEKKLTLIKTIDNSLDKLLKNIRCEHRNNLSIANEIVKIKGLIINILQ